MGRVHRYTFIAIASTALLGHQFVRDSTAQEGQPSTRVQTLEPGQTPEILAGESLATSLRVKERVPDNINSRAYLEFAGPKDQQGNTITISTDGYPQPDRQTFQFNIVVPRDQHPGLYKLTRVLVIVGSTSSPLPIEALQFEVVSDPSYIRPNLNGGSLEFNLTKAQLLRSRAKLIGSRLDDVKKSLAAPRLRASPY
jgi:hypothetical protein